MVRVTLLLWLFFVWLAVPCLAEVELRGTPGELQRHFAGQSHRVTLSAEAELKVQADRALVKLRVATKHKKLRKALDENQRIQAERIYDLDRQGIAKERIASSRYSSIPKPGLFGKTGSYQVQHAVTVTIDDERRLKIIAGFIDEHAEVQYEGMTFEHTDQQRLKTAIITQAFEKLAARQMAYEQALGVRIVLLKFTERSEQAAVQCNEYRHVARRREAEVSLPASLAFADEQAMVLVSASRFTHLTFTHQISAKFRVVAGFTQGRQ